MARRRIPTEEPFDPISEKLIVSLGAGQGTRPQVDRQPGPALRPVEGQSAKAPRPAEPHTSASNNIVPFASESAAARMNRPVKFLVTRTEEAAMHKLMARLADAAGTTLKLSHLLRSCLEILFHCEPELAEHLQRARLVRPLNEKRALAQLERRLAEIVHAAAREARPIRYNSSHISQREV